MRRVWKTTEITALQVRIAAGEDPDKVCADIGCTRDKARRVFGYYGIPWGDLLARGLRARQEALAKLYHETRARAELDGAEKPYEVALATVRTEFGLGRECAYKWLRAVGRPARRPLAFTRAEILVLVNRFQNGETYADIADSLGAPRPTVRTAIRRHREAIDMPELGDLRRGPRRHAQKRRKPEPKTHCKHNHAFDEANTRIRPDGSRACRACGAARVRAARAAAKPQAAQE